MRSPEGFEKDAIKKFLATIDCWHFSPFMKGFGKNGVPDIVGCYKGRLFGIEVKRSFEIKPTSIQLRRMGEIRKAGGIAIVGPAAGVIEEFKYIFHV